jgi:SAM-dependent methyltransferase
VIELRRRHLEELIHGYTKRFQVALPSRALDFGGDEGQFIPSLPSIQDKRVFEISGNSTVAGVQRIQSWDEVHSFVPDLVMMCHVLEHARDARDLLEKARACLKNGGILYLEVPLDRMPSPSRVLSKEGYARYVKWVSKSRRRWISCDFLSLVSRRYLKRCIPGSVVKQSEHIQFFNETSLTRVLIDLNFTNLAFSTYSPSTGIPRLKTTALGVLATCNKSV